MAGPTCSIEAEGKSITVPDLSQWRLEDFPEFAESVAIEGVSQSAKAELGFDPVGVYNSIKDLKLGFLSGSSDDSEQANIVEEGASLNDIGERTGQSVDELDLESVGELLKKQSLESLAGAVKGLAATTVQDAPAPLRQFLSENIDGYISGDTIQELINGDLSSLSLENISLYGYTVGDFKNLADAALNGFEGYKDVAIGDIPNLSQLSLDEFFTAFELAGAIARADIVFGEAEQQIVTNVVSGSIEGKSGTDLMAVPCDGGNCPHVELGNLFDVPSVSVDCAGYQFSTPFDWLGDRWVGGTQQVDGGIPPYCLMPNRQEPTGRPLAGPFKMVLDSFDEASGTADLTLYMRLCCKVPFADLGCTPYFIPTGITLPIPIEEEGLIFLGPGGKG